MKMYQVVNVLGAINETGKLASDMYDIGKKRYYSESHGQEIPISEMDFQYMVRAFVKLCEQENMLDRSKHMGRVVDVIKAKDSIINGLRSQVETLNGIIEEKDETIQKMLDKPTWTEQPTNGHRYVFSEIPNNEYGKKLARGMKVFLNDESYTMRVRGQHLKPELYGTGKASYGQSIEDSTHLRIYIDKKKGE
tara:strand:- start:579 stop:1157 length:579 start_codon:yes stop_codon:yes gene_type:complete